MKKLTPKKAKSSKIILFVILLRIALGPLIFISSLWALVANVLVDWSDSEIFKRQGFSHKTYAHFDKLLDLYWYAWIVAYLYVNPGSLNQLFFFLFILRLAGQLLFFFTKQEIIFVFFPNVFEILFFVYVMAQQIPFFSTILTEPWLPYSLCLMVITVIIREYVLHIRKANLSWFFTGKTTYWPDKYGET